MSSINMVNTESNEFLASCLSLVLNDQTLVPDVAAAAALQGISAVTIARGLLDVGTVAEKLYLTDEEAADVVRVCEKMVAEPDAAPSAALAMRLENHTSRHQLDAISEGGASQQEESSEPAESSVPEAAAAPAVAPAPKESEMPAAAAEEEEEEVSGLPPLVMSEAPEIPAEVEAKAAAKAAEPVPKTPASTPAKKAAAPAAKTPVSAAKASTPKAAPSSTTPKARPSSARNPLSMSMGYSPAKASPKPDSLRKSVSIQCSQDNMHSPLGPCHSSPSVPSYLRPTAAHMARASRNGPLESHAEESDMKKSINGSGKKKGGNVFSRIGSTLLAPTAAFVARVTGRNDPSKKDTVALTKSTAQLSQVLSAPQGQRVTRAEPFRLSTDARPKVQITSQAELDELELQKQWKRNPVPKHVHEARPLEFRAASKPTDPKELFQPFQLASLERHQAMQDKLKARQAERKAKEEEARVFKARQLSTKMLSSPQTPRKPDPAPPTQGEAPKFASEARVEYHRTVLDPIKKAKEAELNKEKLEEEAKQKALEEMSVDQFRKTLEFRAMKMPDFSAPFRPDPALAKPVTPASEPALHTDKRLGKAVTPSQREDKEGDGLGRGVFDGAGYANAFTASLRGGSGRKGVNPLSQSVNLTASMNVRKSLNLPLSSAAQMSYSPSGTGKKLSARDTAIYGSMRRSLAATTAGPISLPSTPAGKTTSMSAVRASASATKADAAADSPRQLSGSRSARAQLMSESVGSLLQAAIRAAAQEAVAAQEAESCVKQESRSRRATSESITVLAGY